MAWNDDTARLRINRARELGLTKLSLRDLRLDAVPDELAELSGLTKLDLTGNRFAELPDWLGRFGQLTELHLTGNWLADLPESIGVSGRLRRLSLGRNRFRALPSWIAGLHQLVSLNIGGNPLQGSLEWIGDLEWLRELYLSDLGLRRIPDWTGRLQQLTMLSLAYNQITELPDWICGVPRLRRLWLKENRLTELPESLRSLDQLTWLDLAGNDFTELPRQISSLRNIRDLSIGANLLAELPDWIGGLTTLRSLDASSNRLLELPGRIGRLSSLKRLWISRNRLAALPAELGDLSALTVLDLGGNRLCELPDWICGLPRLTTLNMNGNRLLRLPDWIHSLNRLRVLNVGLNRLTGLPEQLGDMSSLVGLHIDGCSLEAVPAWISRLTGLRRLSMTGNQITTLPESLGKLTGLRQFDASDNRIDALPEALARLRGLEWLRIDSNRLAELPAWISSLRHLERLEFRSNMIAHFPEWIGELGRLSHLDASSNIFTHASRPRRTLTCLEHLWLSSSHLERFPEWISELSWLKSLHIGGTRLDCGLGWIGSLKMLAVLNISDVNVTEVPEQVSGLTGLRALYLGSDEISELPEWIGELQLLSSLSVHGNQLSSLPESMAQLRRLKFLRLSNNKFAKIPQLIGDLTGLTFLDLSGNGISDIPESLARLARIGQIWIERGNLNRLPEFMGNLNRLTRIWLSNNDLSEIPSWIGGLLGLEDIDVSANRLSVLPDSMAALSGLTKLFASGNELSQLPSWMRNLTGLSTLDVHDNKITHLPDWLLDLPCLDTLTVYGNPLLSPPPELATSNSAVIAFLKARREGATRQWVSKMLVVGEGGVGKTSVVRNLLGAGFDPREETTHGIRIHRLDFDHPTDPDTVMQLSTWDFGGQQIYHATHQFFLSDRSVFLLLWNNRLGWEQGRLRYWLDIIAARAPESPVVLVATNAPAGGRPVDLPLDDLRREYPQIVDSLSVDNQTGDGIGHLRDRIAENAAKLPLMGSEWPTTWLAAADAVRALSGKWATPRQLWDAMTAAGLLDGEHQRYIAGALHLLGDILFYQDDPELGETVILRPEWVNEFMSKVLDSPEVERCHGLLNRDHLRMLWSELDRDMQEHFLGMMDRYDLSYRLGTGHTGEQLSLVVERLPWNAPDYSSRWDATAAPEPEHEIKVIYQLNTTPPGIPTWFIARSHRFTTNTHWRTGALFAHHDGRHRALVRSDAHRNIVELAVRGPHPASFFALLDDGLNLTLERYPGLSIKRMVPCPCASGAGTTACDELFDYEDLLGRLNRTPPRETIECRKSGTDVYVPSLLYGLAPGNQADLQNSFERVLETMNANHEAVIGRFDDLSGDLQRQFLKLQRRIQDAMEAKCPSVFAVVPVKRSKVIGSTFEIRLYCEEPGAWHPLSDDSGTYQVSESPQWLQRYGPYLHELVKMLKHAVPFAGPVVGMTIDAVSDRTKADLEAMNLLVEQIPSLTSSRLSGRVEDGLSSLGPESRTTTEADFRELQALLEKLDPIKTWGGLSRVATPEGLTVYLCPEHAAPYAKTAPASGGDAS